MILKPLQLLSVITIILCSQSYKGFCCANANAGDIEFRLIKLHYENLSGEKGLTTLFYNEKGVMYRAHWELLDRSRSSENYYTYDENENLIKKYREFSDGIKSTQIYKYDKKGKLISEHFNRSDGVTGTANYEYDENEKLIKAICNGLAGWFYGIIMYEYDADEIKTKGIIEKNEKQIGTIYFEYDSDGNLIKEYWDFPGSWSQTFIYEYEELTDD